MISKGHSKLSIVKQCDLLKVHRSGLYYRPKPESELNLKLMREMDEHYIHHPFKGARRMHVWLTKDRGYTVSKNRIERLYYKVMGLRAILPGRHTSRRYKQHKVYPYLLRNLEVTKVNQVWATDITYIPNYDEIGEMTNLSSSQVKVYIFRARKSMKQYIGKLDLVL